MPASRATRIALTLSLVVGLALAGPTMAGAQAPEAQAGESVGVALDQAADGQALTDPASPQDEGVGNVTGGFLDWGVKSSFRNYIVGPIAQGEVILAGGATANADGTFRFPVVTGPELVGSFDPTTGSVTAQFGGSVTFQGHKHHSGSSGQFLLQLTIGNIRIEATSTSGVLIADMVSLPLEGGTSDPHAGAEPISYPDVVLATLDLTSVSPVAAGADGAAWLDVPTALAAEGQPAFGTFYTVGTPLDPASFTLFLSEEVDLPDPPPADDEEPGVVLDKDSVAVGEELTASGSGFKPGEQVEVWVHSTPVWVGTTTAGADGFASYTFVVPPEVPPGEHRVELRGISSELSLWSADFTVEAGSASGASGVARRGTLPATGPGDLNMPLALLGSGALVLGAALLISSRRLGRAS